MSANVAAALLPSANGRTQLKAGEKLAPDERLASRNGTYTFVNQTDGNIVLYELLHQPGQRAIWSSNTWRKGSNTIVLLPDGNLVCGLWSTGTSGRGSADSVLIIQDNGNAVIQSLGKQIWATNTEQKSIPPAKPEEKNPVQPGEKKEVGRTTLKVGEGIEVDQRLTSPNGQYALINQTDGNIVFYQFPNTPNAKPLWASDTYDEGVSKLTLNGDGRLSNESWTSNLQESVSESPVLVVLDSGDAQILSGSRVLWSVMAEQEKKTRPPSNIDSRDSRNRGIPGNSWSSNDSRPITESELALIRSPHLRYVNPRQLRVFYEKLRKDPARYKEARLVKALLPDDD